jgi:hypothetical protein
VAEDEEYHYRSGERSQARRQAAHHYASAVAPLWLIAPRRLRVVDISVAR